AGIRYADLRGYSYDRSDVSARGLANAYAQTLGTVFTQEPKPYEIEIVVAEVGEDTEHDQIYRLTYDGSVADQHGFVVMGGTIAQAEVMLQERWRPGLSLGEALALAVDSLALDPSGGVARTLAPDQLEVAVLDRQRPRRKFRRIGGQLLADLLNIDSPVSDAPETDDRMPGHHNVLTGESGPLATETPETPEAPEPPDAPEAPDAGSDPSHPGSDTPDGDPETPGTDQPPNPEGRDDGGATGTRDTSMRDTGVRDTGTQDSGEAPA
ncbi:MAG: proteasome subunit alpha, partial [Lapillicoccus sp.]